MDAEKALCSAIHADPLDRTAWLALADWLEEGGQPERGELLRLHLALIGAEESPSQDRCQTRAQQLLANGVQPYWIGMSLELSKTQHLEVVLVPPGRFTMGVPDDEPGRFRDEVPQHRVTLSRPFYIGRFPVTQGQWWAVQRRRPAHFKGANRPVERVSWGDCQTFCQKVSARTGRHVRLPTEAEWEYACRAGTTTAFASGHDEAALSRVGWFSQTETMPVGQKQPNGWGLCDMHGNVWEWCADAYEDYPNEEQIDPLRGGESDVRVARGGSYSNPRGVCRSACRIGFMAGGRNDFIGFRVALDW